MKIPRWLRPEPKSARPELRDIFDEAKGYFFAQTIEPLKAVGRTLAYGLVGAVFTGFGLLLCLVGLLRALQFETGTTFHGTWSFVPYIAAAGAGVIVALASVLVGLRRYRKRAAI